MARPKEFDRDEALDAAIGVFREHGYAATTAGMLTDAMRIGRQSLYDTFGDKWQLYCLAVQRYADAESVEHVAALRSATRAVGGISNMIERVVAEARKPCLGVSSICEFGDGREDLVKIRDAAGRRLRVAIVGSVREAQADGDVSTRVDPEHVAGFLLANVAAIRLAARGGAGDAELQALGHLALQALR
ncbi:TetR/AcrR family transcriptional regulator [Rhizobiaceae bacterium n13]|uniref:TetR/AcrR family transcriptional regulator n=1 Tax=Ferirhizobium litorale TaxID=2927786 RepID=A0AAE3QDH6_9HYPH|nr:TetR/AcrR family transcriptional regulator [Fererhizobium litorale]MDI7861156.1 TetR/AcrR family transcriptional regulator [Fererhizobium litorale]MDI7921303.1 TetR/AcrR family transcriptional regulator [Fererhizobium litorale]